MHTSCHLSARLRSCELGRTAPAGGGGGGSSSTRGATVRVRAERRQQASLLLGGAGPAAAAAPAEMFAVKCAGCHVGGGNIVQPGATLFQGDLDKSGLANAEPLFSLIYSGKGRMPGFGEQCTPKGACTFGPRLSDDEVRGLAEYVLAQAAAGWAAQ